jgi:hypothetical protein
MPENSPTLKFHPSFVRKLWFSFIWRFFASLVVLGIVLGMVIFAIGALGIPPRPIWWIKFITQFLVIFLSSYWALAETMNMYLGELKGAK